MDNEKHKQVEVKLEFSDSESEEPSDKEPEETSRKALAEAKSLQSKSKHPSFVAVMRSAYVLHCYLVRLYIYFYV